jgi:polyhydroxyalkanoate synthesis regulator phasin
MKISMKTLGVAAALVVAGAATFGAFRYASAQQGSETPGAGATDTAGPRQQAREAFLDKVAANLNITTDALKAAIKSAGLETVQGLVNSGKLTEEQGGKLTQAINSGKYPELRRLFHRRADRVQAVRRGIAVSAANAIGIEPKDLATELKDGKSIADVAAEHNISLDTVKTQITTDAKTKLDALVAKGTITQEREDAALQKLSDNLDTILNHHKGDNAPVASPTAGA